MKKSKAKPPVKVKRRRNKAMQAWLDAANEPQRQQLARKAGTEVNHLYQLAGGHRQASRRLAIKLERASHQVEIARPKGQKPKALPPLYREDLAVDSCGICEFAKACRAKQR
jgi:hypothetical protein